MEQNLQRAALLRLQRVAKKMERNNIEAHVVSTRAEVVPLVESLVAPGVSVAAGGSVTLNECGVMNLLRSGRYNFLDRDAAGVDRREMMRRALLCDVYLASANAITERGEIYEIDGNGNRVAAITYGPERVILVAGCNKLVADLDAARARRAYTAAPANVMRLGIDAPCKDTGVCVNCQTDARICCKELVLYREQQPGRLCVVLVAEQLGY